MHRRSAALVFLGCCLLAACDLTDPGADRTPSLRVAWAPAVPPGPGGAASAVQVPAEFLWAAETLDLAILDALGVTRTGSWPVSASGVSVDATFRLPDGPFRTTATVTSNGARRLLEGERESSADQVTVTLQASGPVMAVTPLVARPDALSPAALRVWNIGNDSLAWGLGSLEPANSSCPGGRCLAFRVPDRSAIPPGDFREVLVAGYDTPGGVFDLTLRGGSEAPGVDRVVLSIEAGPAEPVGRIVVQVSSSGRPVTGAVVEVAGPFGAFLTGTTDAQGLAAFAGLPFGQYEVFVFVIGGPQTERAASLDPFSREARVEVVF